jgi:hypothetical protein
MALMLASVNELAGARVVCEQLLTELCAFAVSSASRRCVLENTQRHGRPTEYQCRTSGVAGWWRPTPACARAASTAHRRHLLRLAPRPARRRRALCSPACFQGCPNIVDLYSNLAAAEGKSTLLTNRILLCAAFCSIYHLLSFSFLMT